MQIEALQAGSPGRQRGTPVRALADPPRLPERHADLGADDTHVTLKIPQHHRVEGQALPLQPPQVVHQQVRIRPLRARTLMDAQEPVCLSVDRALGPDDRPRPPPAPPRQLLNPELTNHNLPSHMPSEPMPANMTDVLDQVGK